MVSAGIAEMRNPWWRWTVIAVTVESICVGVNVWAMWKRWNAPWWSFCFSAFALATTCAAAAFVIATMWRNRDLLETWDRWHDEG